MSIKWSRIMKIILLMFIGINLLACGSENMLENEGEFLEFVDANRSYKHIKYLSKEIGSRVSASNEEKKAAEYIKEQFEIMGYKVDTSKFKVDYGKSINIEAIKSPSGKDKNDTDEIVYVIAHYDSVGNAPGANDNASGVAAILEIANAIKDLDVDKEIRFVAFGSEEFGLRGSKNYVKKLTKNEVERSIACFNLDMVATGYSGFDEIRAYTVSGDKNIVTDALFAARKEFNKEKYNSVINLYDDTSNGEIDSMSASDHYSFSEVGIPSGLFTNINSETGAIGEPYTHSKDDAIENISLQNLERSINLIGKAIYDTINN